MRLLVAIDGSDCSLRAADFAAKLAAESRSSLTILNVIPQVKTDTEDLIILMKEELGTPEKAGKKYLARAEEAAKAHGVSPKLLLKEGDPVTVILDESEGFDMIIAGTHGRGKVEKILLGSISTGLIHRSKIPVTVVH
jgi:nucleotide-binding universal stress UspA family protein